MTTLRDATAFPEAAYFIVASRLRPGLDGGYTVATMRRALDFEREGGITPTILTVDFWPDYDAVRDEFVAIGLATEHTVMRNLYGDFRADPAPLREAARGLGIARPPEAAGDLVETVDLDGSGRPWRITAVDAGGRTRHTDFLDAEGRRLLRLPYIAGRADWHRADVAIDVFDETGDVAGQLLGFGALYRLWIDGVVRSSGASRNVVVCEAKQVGELLAAAPRSYALVHTVHNAHTLPPHEWDSPMDDLWGGWFERIDDLDAIVWLTAAQRADAERRFGAHPHWIVVPHPADALPELPSVDARDPFRVVMIARLAEQKRVDDAIRAWPALLERVPGARLDIYGDGPLRGAIDGLISELGVGGSVVLRGHEPRVTDELDTAAALLLTSRYEGQGLVVVEALSHGCPVVAYDVHYGPGEMIEHGRSGLLVGSGDVSALADALAEIVGDRERIAAMSLAAWEWARDHGPEVAMAAMAELFRDLTSRNRIESKVE